MEEKHIYWDSHLYAEKHSFVYQYGSALLELLAPVKGEKILDLGCGNGALSAQIAALGAEVVGIDASAEMIQSAKNANPHLRFEVMDATNFEFMEKFDAVFSNATMHWVKDQAAAARQIYQSLREGGRFVAEFGGKDNNRRLLEALKKSFIHFNLQGHAQISFWYFPSISEYSSLLEKAGFEVSYCHLFPRPTELSDPKRGIIDWFNMFGEKFFQGLQPDLVEKVLQYTQGLLTDTNFLDGKWYADYVRLRVVAKKPRPMEKLQG